MNILFLKQPAYIIKNKLHTLYENLAMRSNIENWECDALWYLIMIIVIELNRETSEDSHTYFKMAVLTNKL